MPAWRAAADLLILFTLTLPWKAVMTSLTAKSVEGGGAAACPLIFLPFISSAFVLTDTMSARWKPSPTTSR
ncbi:hypothetical protein ACIOKD_26175 [Streptomyces sp. NPDC087844]|uniref:hypothetical protein n=1 Tax=Streptomyces sp. NPDC087844 TaxID=3365805 RepID=UPI003812C98F